MPLLSNYANGSVHSGFLQGFWMGVAAVFIFLILLLLLQSAARRCCCCCYPARRPELSLHGAADNEEPANLMKRIVAGNAEVRGSLCEAEVLSTSPPQPPQNQRLSGMHATDSNTVKAGQAVQVTESLLLRSAAVHSYGTTVSENVPAHPYNTMTAETSAQPANPQSFNQSSGCTEEGHTKVAAVSANADEVPEEVGAAPLLVDLQEADELEEEFACFSGSRTLLLSKDESRSSDSAVPAYLFHSCQATAVEERQCGDASEMPVFSLPGSSPNQSCLKNSCEQSSFQLPSKLSHHRDLLQHTTLTTTITAAATRQSTRASRALTPLPENVRSVGSSAPRKRTENGSRRPTPAPPSASRTENNEAGFVEAAAPTEAASVAAAAGAAADGGEAATRAPDRVEVDVQAHREALQRVQLELQDALTAKEAAEATRRQVEDEVRDMQRYKATLDGIVAFTLRELEDAASGVEEAEAQLRSESTQALQRVLAAQEELRHTSLEVQK